VRRTADGSTLVVHPAPPMDDLVLGESIAIDGACLTVTKFDAASFEAQASLETLERTTLGTLKDGDTVHLERALRMSDRLGGHLVLGHVDGVGEVVGRVALGEATRIEIAAPGDIMRYIIEKGSITVDGVSLTVNGFSADRFDVVIIPHTADATKLGAAPVGQRVNLEADVVGKYVHRFVHGDAPKGGIDREFLERWSAS
jgi:riboflavin synthase